ncbi:unnamed protein product [Caenorhabditis auriculariae]|uniref:Bestrophin homolog n=1 Tax=Caenorhabditis auriculariae TaxID=2777116 RepID=A0A8S1HFZ9_9PELO|nr:unnamed protein product [Caenorhabditis auriculariae]
MAYNYHFDIATSSRGKILLKLIFKWKSSIWKAVYGELIVWCFLYFFISIIYRFALNEKQQDGFERFVLFINKRMGYIPVNFMLGFFVTIVSNRWTTQFGNLGMIDNIALFTSAYVNGRDERSRNIRRNIVRYCVMSQTMVFRDIHFGVRKRFPTLETMVAAGIMMPHELHKFNDVKTRYAKYWLGFNWALHLLNLAKKEGRIDGDIPRDAVAQEIRTFRTGLSLIWTYDWVPLPLMYPQLVFMAVHCYFLLCLIGRQFIIRPEAVNSTEIDLWIPFMTIIEFLFYMGWLKVAMDLLNPFGEDDDDFDCNFLIDRNLTVSMAAVDDSYDDLPEIRKDMFWDDTVSPLYSSEAAQKNVNFYMGSATNAVLPEVTEYTMVPHPTNERHDRYAKNPARRTGTTTVSVVKNDRSPPMQRKNSTTSVLGTTINNLFRRRTSNTLDLPNGYGRDRCSSEISNRQDHLSPNYTNPTFLVEMDGEDGLKPSVDNTKRESVTSFSRSKSFNHSAEHPDYQKKY